MNVFWNSIQTNMWTPKDPKDKQTWCLELRKSPEFGNDGKVIPNVWYIAQPQSVFHSFEHGSPALPQATCTQ